MHTFIRSLIWSVVFICLLTAVQAQQPVSTSRPRVLLNSTIKNQLLAKKAANDPSWLALKASADEFATWPLVAPWSNTNNQVYRNDEINYYYQGSRWVEVTLPLALAYQMTGDTKYSNKLKALADVIIGAGDAPIKIGAGYPSRNIGRVVAIIYDWCYDELSVTQRNGLVDVMKKYYKFLRFDDPNGGAYQNYESATGNYYWGNPDCAAFMGYALSGDDGNAGDLAITAAEMIAWARYRFDGFLINGMPASYKSFDYVKQTFDGGYPTLAGRGTNLSDDKGNPHKGGIHVQGWSYGSDVFSQYIDYVQLVKTATGEDLIGANQSWWIEMLRAQKHSLLPNGYHVDEMGDNGTNYGIRIRKALPLRLAFVLQGTTSGNQAQYFLKHELLTGAAWDANPVEPESWEQFYYGVTQTETVFNQNLYYSGFNNGINQGKGNGSMPYFIMRDNWGTGGTWISYQASAATIDDHDHFNAGNIDINYKGTYLISSPSESNYAEHSGASNTLYINDRGDFQSGDYRRVGGQSIYGRNQIKAANQNDSITFVRADLTTAYNKTEQNLIAVPANRKLEYFYRNFLYIRPSNILVVYDQTKVKSPTSGSPYVRHLRWHFADGGAKPVITGNHIKAVTSGSSLYIHTLLPEAPGITLVDQSNNPDAGTFGTDDYFDTDTWRAEVSGDPAVNETDYLSVLQPGSNSNTEMETLKLSSTSGNMDGVVIKTRGGARHDLVFFNKEDNANQAPVTTATLPVAGLGKLYYTLLGMEANAQYTATVAGDGLSITLQKQAGGTIIADLAGVVRFVLDGNNPVDGSVVTGAEEALEIAIQLFPNPSNGKFVIESHLIIHQVEVTDTSGKIIPNVVRDKSIDLTAQQNGLYLVRCFTTKGVVTKKVAVVK